MEGYQCICSENFTTDEAFVQHINTPKYMEICIEHVAKWLALRHEQQMRQQESVEEKNQDEVSDRTGDVNGGSELEDEDALAEAINEYLKENIACEDKSCPLCHKEFPLRQLEDGCAGCSKWFDSFMAQQVEEFEGEDSESEDFLGTKEQAQGQEAQPKDEENNTVMENTRVVKERPVPKRLFTPKVMAWLAKHPYECPFITCRHRSRSLKETRAHISRCKAPTLGCRLRVKSTKAPEPKIHKCYVKGCDELFTTKATFITHMNEDHEHKRHWKCLSCGYIFLQKPGWKYHMVRRVCTRE